MAASGESCRRCGHAGPSLADPKLPKPAATPIYLKLEKAGFPLVRQRYWTAPKHPAKFSWRSRSRESTSRLYLTGRSVLCFEGLSEETTHERRSNCRRTRGD
jgi:hypothetical protein